jgi:ribosome-associated translation inhibitor RaiA
MQIQITFRHVLPTWELEEQIHRELDHLRRLTRNRLTWCHVVIEQPHQRQARPIQARILIRGSWGPGAGGRVAMATAENERASGALARAFETLGRDLRATRRRQVSRRAAGRLPGRRLAG